MSIDERDGQARNLKVIGSNPAPAPNLNASPCSEPFCFKQLRVLKSALPRVQHEETRDNFVRIKP